MRPADVKKVLPINLQTFLSIQWNGGTTEKDLQDIRWLAAETGFKVGRISSLMYRGKSIPVLPLRSKALKPVLVHPEWWIVVYPTGTVRTHSSREYRNTYREVR